MNIPKWDKPVTLELSLHIEDHIVITRRHKDIRQRNFTNIKCTELTLQ